jgi:predicted NAD/FAD-binding protein
MGGGLGLTTQSQCILIFKKTIEMKIAIIGSGNLGLSIAKGLVYNNTYTSLYLSKRDLNAISNHERQ